MMVGDGIWGGVVAYRVRAGCCTAWEAVEDHVDLWSA